MTDETSDDLARRYIELWKDGDTEIWALYLRERMPSTAALIDVGRRLAERVLMEKAAAFPPPSSPTGRAAFFRDPPLQNIPVPRLAPPVSAGIVVAGARPLVVAPCVACTRFEAGQPDDVKEGRCTCGRRRVCENERCRSLLPQGHPAVYCTNACALEDA
jgi:hypothetical protein